MDDMLRTLTEAREKFGVLSTGAHEPNGHACVMEAISWMRGGWGDKPPCVHPTIAAFARVLNDRMPDAERQVLWDLIPQMMDTAGIPDERLRFVWADAACRIFAPIALERAGLHDQAAKLRALPKIDSASAADSAGWAADLAHSAAYSAHSAAHSAAYSAADSAGWSLVVDTFRAIIREAKETK